jgi:hypothetical protein
MSAAFLRHALSTYHTAATKVGIEARIFDWRTTYFFTLCSFHDAVLRWAMSIRAHHVKRTHTNLIDQVADDTRTMHAALVMIARGCESFTLTSTFTAAINRAREDMEAHAAQLKELKRGQKRKR